MMSNWLPGKRYWGFFSESIQRFRRASMLRMDEVVEVVEWGF